MNTAKNTNYESSDNTMLEESLYDLLSSFETNLESVRILGTETLARDAIFIRAELGYPDFDMIVPFVWYEGKDWLFAPRDWQSAEWLRTSDEIDQIDWYVNTTDIEGIIYEGIPMLAPWVGEIKNIARTHRKELGAQLRDARKAAGMTVRDAMDASGVNMGVISRTENGRANTTIDTIFALADCYGVSLSIVPQGNE